MYHEANTPSKMRKVIGSDQAALEAVRIASAAITKADVNCIGLAIEA